MEAQKESASERNERATRKTIKTKKHRWRDTETRQEKKKATD